MYVIEEMSVFINYIEMYESYKQIFECNFSL